MKMTKKLLALVGGVAILASAFVFTGCKDEDENDMLDGYSISLTNDNTLTANGKPVSEDNPAIRFARSWNVTKTKHLSADAVMTIDRVTKDAKGNTTTTTGGNNAAYIFGLKGSGSAEAPYSFYLLGFRLLENTPQYFISYYTGVQSSYCNSDEDDFDVDVASNTAYEYTAVKAWQPMPANSYDLTESALKVYIDLSAIYGTSDTEVTEDNYSVAKAEGIKGYKVTLKPSKNATGVSKTLKSSNFTAQTYNNKKAASTLSDFIVEQAYLGFYAMVSYTSTAKTLVANLEFDNDSIVRSAAYGPTDDFGKEIDIEGEVLKNF